MDATKGASNSNPNVNHINHGFTLSPHQEELLFAALNSNKPNSNTSPPSANPLSMAPSFLESPLDGSATLNGFEESPFVDYDYEFDADGGFDYDFANDSQQMIGKMPGTSSSDGDADGNDKRSHPDDDGDDEDGGGKRREGDEKSSKKPGRKPLTSEPTSKRKAQNRAAQRAFRERKEKHLKDLETKVDDLQKASESANHENSILRAQVEKMSMELREYRKRVSLTTTNLNRSPSNGVPGYLAKGLTTNGSTNPSDINFQFEFPKFGPVPASSSPQSVSPGTTAQKATSPVDKSQPSPLNRNTSYRSTNGSSAGLNQTPIDSGDMSGFSGLFSPSLLESVSKSSNSSFDFFTSEQRSSTASNGQMSNGQSTSHSSPSASSNSNRGASSSCGTSPEPSIQSPGSGKNADPTLSTIGEEHTSNPQGNFVDPGFDGIDWFAQQNGNLFDPQLFGDYREPQENILSGDGFTDGFFNDAFAMPDFNSPYNLAPTPPTTRKDKLLDDAEVVPADDGQFLNCNTIWDRLQACPKVKEGEFDLDLLCKDLQKKAKCSETGAVVNETDFNKIMNSYVGQDKPAGTKA